MSIVEKDIMSRVKSKMTFMSAIGVYNVAREGTYRSYSAQKRKTEIKRRYLQDIHDNPQGPNITRLVVFFRTKNFRGWKRRW